jgi:hypothetical protein
MLKGVQAKGRQDRGLLAAEDTEDAAFLVQAVIVPIVVPGKRFDRPSHAAPLLG